MTIGFAITVVASVPSAGEGGGMLVVALVGLVACSAWWRRVRPSPRPEAELPSG